MTINVHPRFLRLSGLTLALAAGVAACGGTASAPPSGAGGSAAAAPSQSSSPSASASAASQGGGQLGMVLEVNNSGWQKVIGSAAKPGMVAVLVMPNQPAAKAGLAVGDVVAAMNGTNVTNANVANREIRKLKVGDKVSLDVQRKNGPAKVDLTVEPAQQLNLSAMLDDAVKKDPNNAAAYFLRAAYGGEDGKAAQADYSKAITLKPEFVSAYVQRGTLMQGTDPGNAMKDFDKAISLDGNYEPTYVNRSVLFSSQKAYDKALQDDQKAVELDGSDPAAYTNLGIGLVNQGKSQDAMSAEDKALQIDPQFGPALLYRGLMYRDASKSDLQNAAQLVRDEKLRSLATDALSKMG